MSPPRKTLHSQRFPGSDPRQGTGPSLLNHNEILRSTSLYYLTNTFVSSIYIYYQNPGGFKPVYTKAATDAPLLFSTFHYNIGFWPKELVEKVGNLVLYRSTTDEFYLCFSC